MKIPKLKHGLLCELIVLSPTLTLFWYILAMLLLRGGGAELVFWRLIGFLAAVGFSLWYLFKHLPLFLLLDIQRVQLRMWRRDRLEYRTLRNGRTRAQAERRILRRCHLWGRAFPTEEPFHLFYRHGISWTVFYSVIEKRVAVCSAEHLTAERYNVLIGRAAALLRRIPDRKREKEKAPRLYASVVILLADRVDDEVKRLVRAWKPQSDERCLFPCVAECPAYYLDGTREYHDLGLGGRPAKNYASALMQKLVFGGILPRADRTKRPSYTLPVEQEQSLWEYLREARKFAREDEAGEKAERKKLLRVLHDGEVRFGEYAIYCKMGDRLAVCAFLPNEEDEKLLSLLPDERWYYHRSPGSVNMRRMKPQESTEVLRRIETFLQTEGYRIQQDA